MAIGAITPRTLCCGYEIPPGAALTTLRADLLDQAVWEDGRSFLCDPQRIQQEYQRRFNGMENREGWDSLDHLRSTVHQVQRGIERMIDAYAEGLLNKEEFEPRIRKAKQRLAKLEQEQKDQADEQLQRANLKVIIGCMQEFAEKIQNGFTGLDWDAKRKIICAIVKQIEVDEEEVHIVYRVSPNSVPQDLKQESLSHCSRRIVPVVNKLLNHLGDPFDAESTIDDCIFAFILLSDALICRIPVSR